MTYALPSRALPWLFGVLASVVLALGTALPAQAQLGESTALFLRIEPDSRAAGMGNAGVAVADNANAMFWNPAGLAFQENTQLGLTHANWLPEFDAGLFYEYLVGTYHVDGIGTFGGNVTFLNLGEIEIRDESGQVLNQAQSYELAVGASYGYRVSDRLGLGTSFRVIYSKLTPEVEQLNITSGSASTVSFDLSALYRTAPFTIAGTQTTFSTGVNLANMGGEMTYNEEPQALPTNIRLGYAFTFDFDEYNSLTFANDFNKGLESGEVTREPVLDENGEQVVDDNGNPIFDTTVDPDPFYEAIFNSWGTGRGEVGPDGTAEELSLLRQFTVGLGVEYWYSDLFALRTGYFYEDPDNGNRRLLNFGAGLRYNIIGVDFSYIYALEEDNPLSNTLRFSVLFSFQ